MSHQRKIIDLTGQKFGRLTVIARADNSKYGNARWCCKCACGGEAIVVSNNLRRGQTKSCGCLQPEVMTYQTRRRTSAGQDNECWDNLAEFDEWPS
jgi:hypothetical protein